MTDLSKEIISPTLLDSSSTHPLRPNVFFTLATLNIQLIIFMLKLSSIKNENAVVTTSDTKLYITALQTMTLFLSVLSKLPEDQLTYRPEFRGSESITKDTSRQVLRVNLENSLETGHICDDV